MFWHLALIFGAQVAATTGLLLCCRSSSKAGAPPVLPSGEAVG